MPNEALRTSLLGKLDLADPFMIASSHWTDNENSIGGFRPYRPAAMTLKTVSARSGGQGKSRYGGREKVRLVHPRDGLFGYYSDGPKALEFWDIFAAILFFQQARDVVPDTKLGLSILEGEDYENIRLSFHTSLYDYLELNLKYTFRTQVDFSEFLGGVREFLDVFADKPILIKVPYEIITTIHLESFKEFRRIVAEGGAGLLVTNTKKAFAPWSRQSKKPQDRCDGVIMGDHLFVDTFTCISRLFALRATESVPTLVATGGITGIGSVVDVLAAGADAVQLCSYFDRFSFEALRWIRDQLSHLIPAGEKLPEYLSELRKDIGKRQAAVMAAVALYAERNEVGGKLKDADEQKRVIKLLAETLRSELLPPSQAAKTDPIPVPQEMFTFVLNKTNVTAMSLTMRCAERHSMSIEQVTGSEQLLRHLKDKSFSYDFVIVPKSVAEDLWKSQDLQDHPTNKPFIWGAPLGQSFVRLMSSSDTAVELDRIFYFGGVASHKAIERLLPQILQSSLPNFEVINAEFLPWVFKYWKASWAILGKVPFCDLYRLCFKDPARSSWKVRAETQEDLVLVVSERTLNSPRGKEYAEEVHQSLQQISHKILEDPEKAARELFIGGYLSYLAGMLGAAQSVVDG